MKNRRHRASRAALLAGAVCLMLCFYAPGGAPAKADSGVVEDINHAGLQSRRLLIGGQSPLTPMSHLPIRLQTGHGTSVTVTYDNNKAFGGEYYRKPRTATIEIKHTGFNPDDFYIGVEYTPYYFQDYGPIERKHIAFSPVSGKADTYRGTLAFRKDGRYILKIEGTDCVTGAPVSYLDSFVIDSVAPVMSLTFDKNKEKGGFFTDAVTGTLKVTEANFDKTLVKVSVKQKLPGQNDFKEIAAGSPFQGVTVSTFSKTIPFTEEGAYSVDITYRDSGGLSAAPIHEEFFIDRTAPVLDVRFDDAAPVMSNYYNQFRKATITVDEANFDPELVTVTQSAGRGGEEVEPPVVSSWQSDGNKHTATILYDKDGEYSLAVSCSDMAGRQAESFAEQAFIIDTTPPAYTVTGITSDKKGEGVIAPVIEFSDPNLMPESVDIQLSGKRRGVILNIKEMKTESTGGRVEYHEFPRSLEMDDFYTISVKMKDKLNNTTSETIRFSVNRFGSTYECSDETKALAGSYVKKAPDIVVTETNALKLATNQVTLFKDNHSATLKEGVDYSLEQDGEDGRFYQYAYRIFSANFTEDGLYRLSISSQDSAGRVSESSSGHGGMDISFIVDNTAPIVSFLNLEKGGTYPAGDYDVIFTADDNVKLSDVILYLDGEKVKEWNALEIEKLVSGKEDFHYIVMGGSNNARHLRVVCADAAGNQTEGEISGFYVTTSRWVQMMNNVQIRLVLYVMAALLVILSAVTVFFILSVRAKKRRKRAQAGAPAYPGAPNDNRMASGYPAGSAIPPYPNAQTPAGGYRPGPAVPPYPNAQTPAGGGYRPGPVTPPYPPGAPVPAAGAVTEKPPYAYREDGRGFSPETWENAIQADHPVTNQPFVQSYIPPYRPGQASAPGQSGGQPAEAYDPSKLDFGETTVLSKQQPDETAKLDELRD